MGIDLQSIQLIVRWRFLLMCDGANSQLWLQNNQADSLYKRVMTAGWTHLLHSNSTIESTASLGKQ